MTTSRRHVAVIPGHGTVGTRRRRHLSQPRRRGLRRPATRLVLHAGRAGEATELLRNIKASSLGDHGAQPAGSPEAKGWVEGTDTAGGFMVAPSILPAYLPALRASSPLRFRCNVVDVRSNEVWLVIEGNTITVEFVAEAGTKPDSDQESGLLGTRQRGGADAAPPRAAGWASKSA